MKVRTADCIAVFACPEDHIHVELVDDKGRSYAGFTCGTVADAQHFISMIDDACKEIIEKHGGIQ